MALTATEHVNLKGLIGEVETAHLNLGLASNPSQYSQTEFEDAVKAVQTAVLGLDLYLEGLVAR